MTIYAKARARASLFVVVSLSCVLGDVETWMWCFVKTDEAAVSFFFTFFCVFLDWLSFGYFLWGLIYFYLSFKSSRLKTMAREVNMWMKKIAKYQFRCFFLLWNGTIRVHKRSSYGALLLSANHAWFLGNSRQCCRRNWRQTHFTAKIYDNQNEARTKTRCCVPSSCFSSVHHMLCMGCSNCFARNMHDGEEKKFEAKTSSVEPINVHHIGYL